MLNYLYLHLKKILAALSVGILAFLVMMNRRKNGASTLSQSEETSHTISRIETQEKKLEELSNNPEKLVPRNADPDEVRRRLRERGLLK